MKQGGEQVSVNDTAAKVGSPRASGPVPLDTQYNYSSKKTDVDDLVFVNQVSKASKKRRNKKVTPEEEQKREEEIQIQEMVRETASAPPSMHSSSQEISSRNSSRSGDSRAGGSLQLPSASEEQTAGNK